MQTAQMTPPWPMKGTSQLNRANIAIGLSISLLLHLLLAAWSWQHKVTTLRFAEKTSIAVQLLPRPPAHPLPMLPPSEPVKPKSDAATRVVQSVRPRAVAIVPIQVAPEKPVLPSSTNPPRQEKHLDMNAVYGSVKSAVAEVDRENAETPVGQLVAKPLYPPEQGDKVGRMIDGTTRPDCKEQVAGMGLLAPLGALATLLDKKDNGCKWR